MNSVLLHLLILWAVIAVVLATIFIVTRRGVKFQGLRYAGIFGFVGAAFGVVIGMTPSSPRSTHPESWYSDALRASLDAGEQRQDRLLLTQPQIPTPLWILIYVGAALIVVFAFFFDLSSRTQLAGMVLAVTLMLTAVLGVLAGLDSPTEEPFGLEPKAMEAERALLAVDVDTHGQSPAAFCAALPVPKTEPSSLR
jgi:hypothetical protein